MALWSKSLVARLSYKRLRIKRNAHLYEMFVYIKGVVCQEALTFAMVW